MARRAEIVAPPVLLPPVLLRPAPMTTGGRTASLPAHGTLSPNELRQIIEGVLG